MGDVKPSASSNLRLYVIKRKDVLTSVRKVQLCPACGNAAVAQQFCQGTQQ
jgi:ribosomal protein S27AE